MKELIHSSMIWWKLGKLNHCEMINGAGNKYVLQSIKNLL